MKTSEIIVIGGGLGGLATAGLLAQAGHRVRVLEQAAHAGGRARSRTEQGFVHNIGAHALYLGGPAYAVLRALGVNPARRKLDGRGLQLWQGGRLHAGPASLTALLGSDRLGARGKWVFARAFATLGERKALAYRGRTVREWLEAEADDPRARVLLEMFVRLTTYTHAPERLSAEVAIRQLASAVKDGVMYVDGGWQTLVDACERRVRELGVQIELGAGVKAIEHAGRAQAVRTEDGRGLPALAVVAAVEPRALCALLPEDPHAQTWAAAAVPARAACLDLGVRALPRPECWNVQGLDAPLYYANHSARAALAPNASATLHLVRYLAPGEDGADKEPELRAFLEQLQPGVYEQAIVKRFMPNLCVHSDIPGLVRAPGAHPALSGLHLVGDWVDSGLALLDGVLASARSASERVQTELARSSSVAQTRKARDAERAA